MDISFTRFIKAGGGIMTKTINIVDGQLKKDGSQCWLSTGTAETITLQFNELPAFLDTVQKNQSVAWGISEHRGTKIVKQAIEASLEDAISRTNKHFSFPKGEPAVMMNDNDTSMSTADLLAKIEKVMPEFKGVARVERPSCSSDIYAGDQLLTSKETGRVYYLVGDGSQIPRIGKILHQRMILAGHGHIQITKSGAMLVRSLVDDCVWQPERLDFVAAPVLGEGLERRVPKARYTDGAALVAANVQDLTDEEELRLDEVIKGLKAVAKPEADKIKALYIGDEADKLIKSRKIPKPDAVTIVKQRTAGNLIDGDVLHFDDLGTVSVADVLSDPAKYDLESLADPLEPDYGRCKAMFFANDGTPTIHSFAHGSRVYHLGKALAPSELSAQDKPDLTLPGGGTSLNSCATSLGGLLAATGRFYVRNGELFEVAA